MSNESSEIIRMFNSAFNELTGNQTDYYPQALRTVIDEWNEFIYPNVNNGVYRCGFATTQIPMKKRLKRCFRRWIKLIKIWQRIAI